ncbi:thioredoxin [Stackebrandtia endophytica]|uniref:Thioredoxin n=1 Tax=Stackebrandtia endophytica TaxID=1496996 RepID=A0A543B184_9ACTN|nr:thioredoxin [Stackebrandtia endophytica]TQL78595.1 thioredoxin [Stackebrandtia endophytica]
MNSSDPRQAPQRLLAGAVDLSSLAQARPAPDSSSAPPSAPPTGSSGVTVIDVTEGTFQSEVLERSLNTPVVIDFWAEWCGPCKQLSPVLEKLAAEGAGSWVLAKVDVDANPQLAQAFQVQSIPMVVAVVGGRPVDAFQGVQPESTLRQWIGKLIEAAGGEAPPVPADPELEAAEAALEAGDLDAAEAAFDRYLTNNPGDDDAAAGLAQVRLLRRIGEADIEAAMAKAAADPDDIPAALLAADAMVISGQAEAAYDRLIQLVARNSGETRDTVRKHLVELFSVASPQDPVVTKARRKLSAVLF